MFKLVLVRHGESDVEQGEPLHRLDRRGPFRKGPARRPAKADAMLKAGRDTPSMWPTPRVLKRAIRTLWTILDEMDLMWIPVHRSWRLNERHYGALQGLNKVRNGRQVRRARR